MKRLALLLALLGSGCTTVHAANQIGGDEKSTWVFVRQSGWRDPGIYRCTEGPQGPVCVRATMK